MPHKAVEGRITQARRRPRAAIRAPIANVAQLIDNFVEFGQTSRYLSGLDGFQPRERGKSGKSMPTAKNILVVNGPNLNLLGSRETRHYGKDTLPAINARLAARARRAKVRLVTFQSNSESELVERVQQARRDKVDFIIINPAAYTHTSVALRDALAAVGIPFVEVHLSNVFAREAFRRESYFTDIAVGIISGLGAQGYELALEFALARGKKR
jgi:3-dehydroquinate dehydratase-2